jgi:hypothetical protein
MHWSLPPTPLPLRIKYGHACAVGQWGRCRVCQLMIFTACLSAILWPKTWWSFATAEQWRRHNLETYGLNDLAFMFYIWQCSKAHPQKLLTILQILKLHLVFFCRFVERQELAALKFIMSKQCGHVGIDMYHLWRSKEWRCVCHHRKIELWKWKGQT